MAGRRIAYLGALLACLGFYGFYREWFSWFLLVAVVLLPWISLLFSLPAMLTVKADLRCPEKTRQDLPARSSLQMRSLLPTPPVQCTIRLVNSLTGERFVGEPGERLPTANCGVLTVSYAKLYVYDYLGLFRRRLRADQVSSVLVTPKPVPAPQVAQTEGRTVTRWRPKHGGGLAENHELRLYRPGDDLRHIHWKMAAKTGKLIYREPMEPVQQGYGLNMILSGTPEQMNRKLGQLLWTSHSLLEGGIAHTVRCRTGRGLLQFTVDSNSALDACLQNILAGPPAQGDSVEENAHALWQHTIGGDPDEA